GNNALGGAREQVDLHEVEESLNREKNQQPYRYAIELASAPLLEGSVKQVPHYLREHEPGAGGEYQPYGCDGEPARVGAQPRDKPAEWSGGYELPNLPRLFRYGGGAGRS